MADSKNGSVSIRNHAHVTDVIIAAIEKGAGTFQMPWHATQAPLLRAQNAATGSTYRGMNIVTLWAAAEERQFTSHLWATYKQWHDLGAQVQKGQRATPIVFTSLKKTEGNDTVDEKHKQRRKFLSRWYGAFNADQVDDWNRSTPAHGREASVMPSAEKFVEMAGARVKYGAPRACYRPLDDVIECPSFEQFTGSATSSPVEAFYATLLHEHVHWTGHASRLNREFGTSFADDLYAQEELVAELGAAFLCADLDITNQPRPDHAAYVSTWLKVMKAQPLALFFAASKAERAVAFLHDLDEMRKLVA